MKNQLDACNFFFEFVFLRFLPSALRAQLNWLMGWLTEGQTEGLTDWQTAAYPESLQKLIPTESKSYCYLNHFHLILSGLKKFIYSAIFARYVDDTLLSMQTREAPHRKLKNMHKFEWWHQRFCFPKMEVYFSWSCLSPILVSENKLYVFTYEQSSVCKIVQYLLTIIIFDIDLRKNLAA